MSFTNCPELSLTFWRSMNDVPGRQLAAAALYLSSPAAAPAATVATGAAAAAPLATGAAAPLSPPSRDDGVHFVGVALSAAAAIDVARPTDRGTDSCSSRQQRWRRRVAITVGVGDDGGATTTTAIAATATPEDSDDDVGSCDHRPPAPASPCRRTSSSPTAMCRGRPSTRSSPGSTARAT